MGKVLVQLVEDNFELSFRYALEKGYGIEVASSFLVGWRPLPNGNYYPTREG